MIDTCGFDGDSVALTAGALADRVGHYGFVSSGSAYADWPNAPVDEDSPLWQDGDDYGAGKADAERAAEAAMPGRVLARPRGRDRRPAREHRPPAAVAAAARRGRRGARARAAGTRRCS